MSYLTLKRRLKLDRVFSKVQVKAKAEMKYLVSFYLRVVSREIPFWESLITFLKRASADFIALSCKLWNKNGRQEDR